MKGIVIGISVAAIIAVTIVIVIFVVVPIVKPIVAPPQVQLTSHSATYVGGIFDQQILISGRVANSGMSASNPVSLGITITDPNGNILYTGSVTPEPSILEPGQEAPFTKYIRPAEIGGYSGEWNYELSIRS